jgi:hypothetical protein
MATPDELLAGGIPTGDEEEGEVSGFLGVPKGYFATRPAPASTARRAVRPEMTPPPERMPEAVPPRYKEGDQYRLRGLAPEMRAMFQTEMDRAGLYGKGQRYVLGDWQETDSEVYAKLLKFANRYGYTDAEALEQMRTLSAEERAAAGLGGAGRGGAGAGAAREPLVVSLSHPDDIRDLADRTARKSLGRKLTADQLSNFVSAYQSMQRESQSAAYGADVTGGTVTQAPSPEVFAEGQVESLDPLAAGAKKEVEVFKIISGALGGMSSRGG